MARPTAYRPQYAEQAAKLCALGATDDDLANFFKVTRQTVANWKVAHQEFFDALKASKEAADQRVERSLYQRAVGYTYDSEKIFNHEGEILRATTSTHVPPDVTAQIFWLKNRMPDQWRDKRELAGDPDHPLIAVIEQRIVDPKG